MADPVENWRSGRQAEAWAEEHLRRLGRFQVLARNWRNPADRRQEIDLIALEGDVLVFVEVKGRPSRALVPGFFAVDRRKRSALGRACAAYLRGMAVKPRTFRLDVIEIEWPGSGRPIVRHFENMPIFPKWFRG